MKYLLTGGSGRLGTELQKLLSCDAPTSKELDICKSPVDWEIKQIKYQAVIHAAAYTDVQKAEIEQQKAFEINVLGTKNIVEYFSWCQVVYISTDHVYGNGGNHKEIDQPQPFNYYGFTKLEGEKYMDPKKDLIIRTSFKPSIWEYPQAFTDLYTSADYIDIIAKEIIFVIQSGIRGIINVGTDRKSMFDLAKRRNDKIQSCNMIDMKCYRPNDISMNLDKLKILKNEI